MKKTILSVIGLLGVSVSFAQGPEVTSWLQNTSGTASYYTSGNSIAIGNNLLYNCQQIEYSNDYVYVITEGVPAYPTGPFLDGNTFETEAQSSIFKLPRNPIPATNHESTTGGTIGVFVNGVSLFDFRDGVAWDPSTNALCGGPGNPPCSGAPGTTFDWNRDAVIAEMGGYDCSKGHPAGGKYHHHQNPTAFKLDLNVLTTICNTYDADGLYLIDSNQHSPLIGYAYDGYPIYGAYGYKNSDGSGGITRIQSGYQLRNITVRTHAADGTNVDDGPPVDNTYFLGYFREDYEWIAHPGQEEYLDVHNGRFCVTPEYPGGTYAYFCTVDANWNSAYPYAVGPTFYGEKDDRLVNSINEPTTIYNGNVSISEESFNNLEIALVPNPAADLAAIQVSGLVIDDLQVALLDLSGRLIETTQIRAGQTTTYFDLRSLYSGTYLVRISNQNNVTTRKLVVTR